MSFIKKYFPIFYIVLMIFGIFYVRGVLKEQDINVSKKEKEEKVEEIKPVNVYLQVKSPLQTTSYSTRLSNINTFDDLLEKLVKSGQISYEKTEYTYGTAYDKINGEKSPEGLVWRVFEDGLDITYNTKGVNLIDERIYRLELLPK